ncbi:MAG: outer membrane insertion C- signal [Cytophagales bacterium]|nr:outer membrane insertion C- signal [Cytophagales bacterium]
MKILKRTLVLSLFTLLFTTAAQSQELGLRFGNALANKSSVAIDAVFGLGKFSRIHADVSFGNGVALEALWDFIYKPIPDSPINWYVGVGPSLYLSSPFALGASGEIGVEYRFSEVPLVVGLDYRPTIVLVERTDFVSSFGFNVRYVF